MWRVYACAVCAAKFPAVQFCFSGFRTCVFHCLLFGAVVSGSFPEILFSLVRWMRFPVPAVPGFALSFYFCAGGFCPAKTHGALSRCNFFRRFVQTFPRAVAGRCSGAAFRAYFVWFCPAFRLFCPAAGSRAVVLRFLAVLKPLFCIKNALVCTPAKLPAV